MADPKELSPVQLVVRLRDGRGGRILEETPRSKLWEQAIADARELEELRAEKLAKFSELTSLSFKQLADYVEKVVPECAPENYTGQAREFASAAAATLRKEAETLHGTALTWLKLRVRTDFTELVTTIASGDPVTDVHRDLARMILERWKSEAKR